MARRDTQPTKQVGEYLVAAELARLGLVCATFSGNVRHYDIVASGPAGGHIAVQVKAKASGAWQLTMDEFAEITMSDETQVIGPPKPEPFTDLLVVLVSLHTYGSDEFFILRWRDLRELVITGHRDYLARHHGRRPRNPRSLHTALREDQLATYRGNWQLVRELLGLAA